ncbi:MAG: nitroreductase family protein [Bacteroidetes bacterium]|nr:nitroreductase family protein [Bacteroidota bacterium]MDA0888143.1 nitroreductase family protein [Bacteroidota bacterium]MDA1084095.1 nitroreductase family protein [Bacteroidota bacterium]
MTEKTVTDAIHFRRSVRVYSDEPLDDAIVKQCLVNASIAPTSSNLQLWEFHHITDKSILQKMAKACMGQNAATTANQLVVIVTRKDTWRKKAQANIAHFDKVFKQPEMQKEMRRKKMVTNYYGKIIPTLYGDFLGILGALKYMLFQLVGLFRPVYRQTRWSDLRVVAHKSAALAAQNFMISMAAVGYDTCPMEGSDTLRIKKILNLPRGAEINMVISCGIRKPEGVYGERFRVPFEEVYVKV